MGGQTCRPLHVKEHTTRVHDQTGASWGRQVRNMALSDVDAIATEGLRSGIKAADTILGGRVNLHLRQDE